MICVKKTLEIKNQKGIHARAAAAFVKAIEHLDVEVSVVRAGQSVNGLSIMGLMLLAAAKGTSVEICATGKQAVEAIEALEYLIDNKFGEEQ